MKYLILTLLLLPSSVMAMDYQPLQINISHFEGHRLFSSVQAATRSASIRQALANWKAVADEAQISDDPSEVEDITHYELYRLSLKELVRLNYIAGNISQGDLLFSQLEALTFQCRTE
jgi:hypothetical protein